MIRQRQHSGDCAMWIYAQPHQPFDELPDRFADFPVSVDIDPWFLLVPVAGLGGALGLLSLLLLRLKLHWP
jgi:hypothetical protein